MNRRSTDGRTVSRRNLSRRIIGCQEHSGCAPHFMPRPFPHGPNKARGHACLKAILHPMAKLQALRNPVLHLIFCLEPRFRETRFRLPNATAKCAYLALHSRLAPNAHTWLYTHDWRRMRIPGSTLMTGAECAYTWLYTHDWRRMRVPGYTLTTGIECAYLTLHS